MKRAILVALCALAFLTVAPEAQAFCGFYVAKADTKLFNRASQVAIARHDDKTVLTMANDFQGDLAEFAIVIPVPTFLEREQIHVADRALLEHLDAYTSPRLVEYFDPDPCAVRRDRMSFKSAMPSAVMEDAELERARGLGVNIEAQYSVGEYDIVLLSATESTGLLTWLTDNGYRLPSGARPILGSYMKQGMRFFLARVNLTEQARLGFNYLRPLQIAFESPKFMLPIRLGTLNADGAQELFVYTLTAGGRVETTNYRTVKLPSGMDIPVYVKERFGEFYRDMFTRQVDRHEMRTVFLEYAWNMAWCDPCAADPLSQDELRQLGVFWLQDGNRGPAQQVFVTRLHVRYDAERFPEDLIFQETGDSSNFQARYVLRHAFESDHECEAVRQYRAALTERWEREAETLADLTGWNLEEVRTAMDLDGAFFEPVADRKPWWRRLWGN